MGRRSRPRRGRIAAAASSAAITVLTVLAGAGVVGADRTPDRTTAADVDVATLVARTSPVHDPQPVRTVPPERIRVAALPRHSGHGRRVVFDISDQRVWLVDRRGDVVRTYLVSGSLSDNLRPGRYAVYSRSRHASGIDGSGQMEFFVRFTRGERAAIGFHSIPTRAGRPVQSLAELGTPRSHGCIRQARADARRLWRFAPIGTPVVVTA